MIQFVDHPADAEPPASSASDIHDDASFSVGKAWLIDSAIVLAACGLCFAYLAARPLDHDVAWYLVSGERWLHGATLYRDIIEVNPPLPYFEVAAILQLPLPAKLAYLAAMVAMAAVSSLWVRRLAVRDGRFPPRLAVLASLAAVLIVPLGDFGQREQIGLAAGLPYLWAIAFGSRVSRGESVALGAFAFLGLGLKPYFLAIAAGAVLVRAMQERAVRPIVTPANLVIAALCGAYVATIILAFPDYLGSVVPIAHLTYFAFGIAPALVLTQPALLIGLVMVVVGLRSGGVEARWAGALAGAVVSYLIQFKGWTYHQIPIDGLVLVMAIVLLADKGQGRLSRPLAVAVAGLAAFTVLIPAMQGSYRINPAARQLAPYLAGARSALIVGENVWITYPLVEELHVYQASRYSAMWPLPGASILARGKGPTAATARQILRDTRTIIVGDFVREQPEVLVIDVRADKPYFRGPFDYLRFFNRDPRFAAAFSAYEKVGRVAWLDVYRRKSVR